VRAALLALCLGGCSLPGLTSVELYGREATTASDAGADDAGPDAPAEPAPDASADGAASCPVAPDAALTNINGSVVDRCSRGVVALVGLTGQGSSVRTCASDGKGSWQLLGVKPGCHLTLAASAPGFRTFTADITVLPGNENPSLVISLESLTPISCDVPPPPGTCSCASLPGCQPPP
jgi:hypothetical protein